MNPHFSSILALAVALGREPLEGTDAAAGVQVLERASERVRNYTRQTLHRVVDDAVTLTGTWDHALFIPERPIVSVSSVTVNGRTLAPQSYTATGGRLRFAPGWRCAPSPGRQGASPNGRPTWGGPDSTIGLVYTHGYLIPEMPGDIVDIVLAMAVRCIENPVGVREEHIGSYGVTFAGAPLDLGQIALSKSEERALRRYRPS